MDCSADAVRAGIQEIILPRENEADLEDLSDEVRARLTIHLVDKLDEVLELALIGGIFREDKVTVCGQKGGEATARF